MGRTMTLRGVINCKDGNRALEVQALDYVSPDRTRGWRIKDAWLWVNQIRASTPNDSDGMMVTQAFLSTELVKGTFDSIANDNRIFAWAIQHYLRRAGGSTDYIIPNAGENTMCKFIFDDDTTIVKELWISMGCTSDGTDEPDRLYNYLINLEEIKISPEQSVFQQIKGMGQEIP